MAPRQLLLTVAVLAASSVASVAAVDSCHLSWCGLELSDRTGAFRRIRVTRAEACVPLDRVPVGLKCMAPDNGEELLYVDFCDTRLVPNNRGKFRVSTACVPTTAAQLADGPAPNADKEAALAVFNTLSVDPAQHTVAWHQFHPMHTASLTGQWEGYGHCAPYETELAPDGTVETFTSNGAIGAKNRRATVVGRHYDAALAEFDPQQDDGHPEFRLHGDDDSEIATDALTMPATYSVNGADILSINQQVRGSANMPCDAAKRLDAYVGSSEADLFADDDMLRLTLRTSHAADPQNAEPVTSWHPLAAALVVAVQAEAYDGALAEQVHRLAFQLGGLPQMMRPLAWAHATFNPAWMATMQIPEDVTARQFYQHVGQAADHVFAANGWDLDGNCPDLRGPNPSLLMRTLRQVCLDLNRAFPHSAGMRRLVMRTTYALSAHMPVATRTCLDGKLISLPYNFIQSDSMLFLQPYFDNLPPYLRMRAYLHAFYSSRTVQLVGQQAFLSDYQQQFPEFAVIKWKKSATIEYFCFKVFEDLERHGGPENSPMFESIPDFALFWNEQWVPSAGAALLAQADRFEAWFNLLVEQENIAQPSLRAKGFYGTSKLKSLFSRTYEQEAASVSQTFKVFQMYAAARETACSPFASDEVIEAVTSAMDNAVAPDELPSLKGHFMRFRIDFYSGTQNSLNWVLNSDTEVFARFLDFLLFNHFEHVELAMFRAFSALFQETFASKHPSIRQAQGQSLKNLIFSTSIDQNSKSDKGLAYFDLTHVAKFEKWAALLARFVGEIGY